MSETKQRRPNLRRMHFRADGNPKAALSLAGAERARQRGMVTYLCPLCGKCHCSGRSER